MFCRLCTLFMASSTFVGVKYRWFICDLLVCDWKIIWTSLVQKLQQTFQLSSRSNRYICCRAAWRCDPSANEQHAFPSWAQTSWVISINIKLNLIKIDFKVREEDWIPYNYRLVDDWDRLGFHIITAKSVRKREIYEPDHGRSVCTVHT